MSSIDHQERTIVSRFFFQELQIRGVVRGRGPRICNGLARETREEDIRSETSSETHPPFTPTPSCRGARICLAKGRDEIVRHLEVRRRRIFAHCNGTQSPSFLQVGWLRSSLAGQELQIREAWWGRGGEGREGQGRYDMSGAIRHELITLQFSPLFF